MGGLYAREGACLFGKLGAPLKCLAQSPVACAA